MPPWPAAFLLLSPPLSQPPSSTVTWALHILGHAEGLLTWLSCVPFLLPGSSYVEQLQGMTLIPSNLCARPVYQAGPWRQFIQISFSFILDNSFPKQ